MKLPFNIDLTGKTAVVTGGGGVLCSEFARALGQCGANIAVLDLRLEAAQNVAEQIKAAGGNAIGLSANVLERESLEKAAVEIENTYGAIDILINGAGGNHPKGTTTKEYFFDGDLENENKDLITFFDLDPAGVQFVFNLNFLGTLLPTQVFAKSLLKREKPVIINVSSMNAFRPLTKIPAYSAAKSAISNFTQWLAVHFAKTGMRVNAIAPGFFVTDQNRALLFTPEGEPTARTAKILAATPMERFGDPSDLIGALLWLCDSNASGFVTGTVIPVDGGFSAYSGV